MNRKRLTLLARPLWWLATLIAKVARRIEGLGFEHTPTPGFDFDHDAFWWDLCQQEMFQRAIRALAKAEEAKALDLLFAFTQSATGKSQEGWQRVAAAGASVHTFRELPWLVIGYGGRYVNQQKKKEVEDARADRLTAGKRR